MEILHLEDLPKITRFPESLLSPFITRLSSAEQAVKSSVDTPISITEQLCLLERQNSIPVVIVHVKLSSNALAILSLAVQAVDIEVLKVSIVGDHVNSTSLCAFTGILEGSLRFCEVGKLCHAFGVIEECRNCGHCAGPAVCDCR